MRRRGPARRQGAANNDGREATMPNGEIVESFEEKLEDIRRRARTVEVDGEELYLVEGDLLLDEDQLREYAARQARLEEMDKIREEGGGVGLVPRPSPALVGITEGGRIIRWGPGVVLGYCVLRSTFERDDQYEEVRDNMETATREWEETCGVKFEHKGDLDASASTAPEGVLFPVRGLDVGGRFIAAAFFPNDPRNRRRVVIDPSYFRTSFDQVGVLRHELGHVLGFRHEHIRSGAPAVCRGESTVDTIDLTAYDPQSCMHYFCGEVGTRDLKITEVDKTGARKVYGLPLAQLRFIDVN